MATGRPILFLPVEQDQVVGEFCQPPGLGLDVGEPFILPQIHRQDLRIGVNDGQRGFQLMSGIGDEPLLLFIAFRHRFDDPPREQDQQKQHRQHTAEADSNAGEHEVAVGIQIPSAVQEDDLIPLIVGVNQVAVIPQKAPGTLFFPDGAGEFHGSFAVNGGDPSGVGGQDYPFFIELDGEIAGFIGEFRRELPDLGPVCREPVPPG